MKAKSLLTVLIIPSAMLLTGCDGIFGGIYDVPAAKEVATVAGELYIDASQWDKWHYIDLKALTDSVAANAGYNTSEAWISMAIPIAEDARTDGPAGIYTYWYDVFGAGIASNEYRTHYLTAPQPEPERWTLAVHRNNVRTNGCRVAATSLSSFAELPADPAYYSSLDFSADSWNEKDVWVVQDRMLLGLIGNQGIEVNEVLSSWLDIDIPPMPPAFTLNSEVFVIALPDGSMGALLLENYQSDTGTKCCLSIKYRYPLAI